jgi:hypothetical protein
MRRIVIELGADAEMLARISNDIGVPKDSAEAPEYSTLHRLLELEAVVAAIDAKRSLWLSLLATTIPMPAGVDLEELELRASQQRDALRPFHAAAAREALTPAHTV